MPSYQHSYAWRVFLKLKETTGSECVHVCVCVYERKHIASSQSLSENSAIRIVCQLPKTVVR